MDRGSATAPAAGVFREPVLIGASPPEILGGPENADGHIEAVVQREIPVPHEQKRAA